MVQKRPADIFKDAPDHLWNGLGPSEKGWKYLRRLPLSTADKGSAVGYRVSGYLPPAGQSPYLACIDRFEEGTQTAAAAKGRTRRKQCICQHISNVALVCLYQSKPRFGLISAALRSGLEIFFA